MNKVSLLIGRWQPLHDGHKALIQSVLDEGKSVCIGIRDTSISIDDPYSIEERQTMIEKAFPGMQTVVIPDIEEIVYGRDVGYGIRCISLNKKVEKISGTSIRNYHHRVIWLTGNCGSGKTSLGLMLKERMKGIFLDGDEMRISISSDLGFSKEDREEHNLRVAKLAKILNEQGHTVIVSVIAPFRDTREKITQICNPFWVYLKSNINDPDRPYEPPDNSDVVINNQMTSITDSLELIIRTLTLS